MRRAIALGVAVLLGIALAPPAQAAEVPLDASFSHNGKVRLDGAILTEVDDVEAVGGQVYAAGVDGRSDPSAAVVVRFEADGSFDATYGIDGVARRALLGKRMLEARIDVRPDGSSAVVVQSRVNVALLHLTPNGELDTSFSGDGLRRWDVRSGQYIQPRVAVDKLGRTVVSVMRATHSGANVVLYRFEQTGRLDATFGTGGVRRINLYPIDWNDALTLDKRGRVLLGTDNAGSSGRSPRSGALIRLRGNGGYDARFSNDGLVRFRLAPRLTTWPIGIGVAPNGLITVGLTSGGTAYGAVRLRADGTKVERYGDRGVFGVTCDCVATRADIRRGRVAITGYRGDRTSLAVRLAASGTSLSQGWVDIFPAARVDVSTTVAWSGQRLVLGGTVGRRGFVARTT